MRGHPLQRGAAFVSASLITTLIFANSFGVLFALEETPETSRGEAEHEETVGIPASELSSADEEGTREEGAADAVETGAPHATDAAFPEAETTEGDRATETASGTIEGPDPAEAPPEEADDEAAASGGSSASDGSATSTNCSPAPSSAATSSEGGAPRGASSTDPVEYGAACIGASVTHVSYAALGTADTLDASEESAPEDNTHERRATIVSGRAIAVANILNILNTNIVNSEGRVFFANLPGGAGEDLDLRPANAAADGGCTLISCAAGSETIINFLNDAAIENLVRVEAVTGGNTVEGARDAAIATGDAYAGLNLVNIANMNFIDATYLLAALNVFGDLYGDIVFPSLARLLQGGPSFAAVALENAGSVENTLVVAADTGGNAILASSSAVATGDALASGNVFNQINMSLVGDASVAVLLKVHGKWLGAIAGGADGLFMSANGAGFYVIGASGALGASGGPASVNGTNTLRIANDVAVAARTGENAVDGAEQALIATGDAYAGANIVNVANANIIGRNWLLAVVNIFGDFAGDIAFGRPDLWMGVRAEAPAYTTNGSEILYTLSVINNGDAEATAVAVVDRFDKDHVDIVASDLVYDLDADGNPRWEIGTLAPGMGTEFAYRGRVKNAGPITWIVNAATVSGAEKDNNIEDNTDGVAILANPTGYGGLGGGEVWTPPPSGEVLGASASGAGSAAAHALLVTRVSATSTVFAGATSTQRITIANGGPDAPRAVFIDELRDPAGNVVHRERWDLGTVLAGEEITLTYDILFGDHAEGGTYLLSSVLERPGTTQVFEANGAIVLLRRSSLAGGESSPPFVPVAAIERAFSPSLPPELEPSLAVPEPGRVPAPPFVRIAYANDDGDEILAEYYRTLGALFTKIALMLLGIALALAVLPSMWRTRNNRERRSPSVENGSSDLRI